MYLISEIFHMHRSTIPHSLKCQEPLLSEGEECSSWLERKTFLYNEKRRDIDEISVEELEF
jgi:hypothetical protein